MAGMGISGHTWSPPLSERYLLGAHKSPPRKQGSNMSKSIPTMEHSGAGHGMSSLSAGKAYLGVLSLPLTPPSLPPDSQGDDPVSVSSHLGDDHVEQRGDATPTYQFETLTPDVTPPRVVTFLRKQEALKPIHPSMSSREDSFTTAKEVMSSDEEGEKVNPPNPTVLRPPKQRPHHPLRTNTLTDSVASRTDGSGDSTPRKRTTGKPEPRFFDSFDGQWNYQQEKIRRQLGEGTGTAPNDGKPPVEGLRLPSRRGQGLRERVKVTRQTNNEPAVQKFAADIGWQDSNEQRARLGETQVRRLSGMSITSTIEAIVIDSPPQKRRTLRHTRKNASLRSASLPVPQTGNRSLPLLEGAGVQRRLSHKSARLSNQDRSSIASDMSLGPSVTSHRQKPVEEVIPVVVIPQRRSSLRTPTCSSRNHSLTRSTKSARRPTTAPDVGTGPFDIPPRRRRTMSESFPTMPTDWRASNRRSRSITGRPKIPARRSSLSAPTTRDNSRAVSLTSDIPVFQSPSHEAPAPPKEPESQKAPTSLAITLDASCTPNDPPKGFQVAERRGHTFHHTQDDNARPHSPLLPPLTPFQPSIQSLSPGPIEISEARAVPFFAHNNESILVVERGPPADFRAYQPYQPLHNKAPNSKLNTTQPQTPPSETPVVTVDSPLRNPRTPPKPPVSGASEAQNNPEASKKIEDGSSLGRRWGSLKRAVSLRRQSELSASLDTRRVRNPKAGKDVDSKEQPFWRPRPFWDDVKDSSPDECTCSHTPRPAIEGQYDGINNNSNAFVGNSLGIPQSKSIFQGPVSLIRRVSNRARSRNSRQMNMSHVSLASSMLSRRSRRNRHYVVPGLQVRLPLYPLKDMRQWLSQARRQREEEKLEARRDQLRKKITRVPIADNDQTIFTVGNRNA